MKAGELRHRIVIQSNTPSANAAGELVPSWGTFATVWAAVEPLTGREYFESQQVQSAATVRMRIRHKATVTPNMRVSWDSRVFDIENVLHDATNNRQTILMTREVQDG